MLEDIRRKWRSSTMGIQLIVVNVVVFTFIQFFSVMGRAFSANSDLLVLITKPWSIVTYMFTHFGLMHLFWNMLLLYFTSSFFQHYIGEKRLLGVYITGGLAGLVLFIAGQYLVPFYGGVGGSIIGASAAVMAVFVAIASFMPDATARLILVGSVKLKYLALIAVFLDFVALPNDNGGVAHTAHLGGAAFGFLYGYYLRVKKTDINWWMDNTIVWISSLFKRKPRMRVVNKKPKEPVTSAQGMRDDEYNQRKAADKRRVDDILDKISKGGYDSLSKQEKDFLQKYSHN